MGDATNEEDGEKTPINKNVLVYSELQGSGKGFHFGNFYNVLMS